MPNATEIGQRTKKIIQKLKRAHADAKLALDFSTPLELLVALILAAQCTDERVNQVTNRLFRRYRRAADYASAPPASLEAAVRPTGFYHQKAKTLRNCCAQVVERFSGDVPADLDALLTLPGVGRKTANILLGNAFGLPGIGVDTHVGRLAQRLGLTRHTRPDKIEADLTSIVSRRMQVKFCHLLQYHGRRICTASKPKCPECPIAALCPYPEKTQPAPPAPRRSRSQRVGRAR